MKSFEGQVALVTGAGGDIGLATATVFAEAGTSMIVTDSDAALIGTAAEDLRAAGYNVMGVTRDVTDGSHVQAMIERAVETHGRLDVAFNNAGINCAGAPLIDTGMMSLTSSSTSTYAACGTA